MSTFLSIVIPAYNEEHRLPNTLNQVIKYLNSQNYSSEIIVVNDGSLDRTTSIVNEFTNKFSELNLIEYFPNKGKGEAVKKGMLIANGQMILFMDADSAVSIEFLDKFLDKINEGYDIAVGSRALINSTIIKGQNIIRNTFGKLYGILMRLITGLKIKDTQCGFKLFTKISSEKIFSNLKCPHQLFDTEIFLLAKNYNIKVVEVPVDWYHDGESRLTYNLFNCFWVLKELILIKKMYNSYYR